ncbi:type I restriction endonuclease subunit R [Deferribacter autotrophicus]|uniref:Type I restriction enzyme endonuclease subunit n=2 Tax=Deferribacter autotrophicus TaxID=500465 RepID=A0A5A8F5W4_9BACT|nr:type I restriction endonuclease subunit R [Deferribacter autotrophicus]KAA0259090.1 type I restriction endonuclease subunit R [Deferribacter autotrophicus]
MPNLNENSIEQFAIDLLQSQGYDYAFGPDIAPDGVSPERRSFEEVILESRLKKALRIINPLIPEYALDDAIKQVKNLNFPELISNNEAFHRMITEGVRVSYQKNGEEKGDYVWLVDFKNPENNDFLVVNQFTVIENNVNKRPDIVLFINGLPLVVMELKNPADENATIKSAYNQIQTYKRTIPSLFNYNEILIISDGLEAKAGSLSAGFDRFMAWKSIDPVGPDLHVCPSKHTGEHTVGADLRVCPQKHTGEHIGSPLQSQLEILIKGLLNKNTLLDYIRFFIVFDKSKREDEKGQTMIQITKKIAAYHQYYAVNKAIESTIRAIGQNKQDNVLRESPASYGLPDVKTQAKGDKKAGVIWHTQGSGKSLSMVFYSGKIIQILNNPTIVVITDRNDLDDQLFDTFAASKQLLRQEPVQAESREHLKTLLKVASGGVVFTTIHKFWPDEGNIYETLSERDNIIVIVDEAHRTQYGFKAKINEGKGEIKYGFAKYLRDALPNATYIAFTGTPIEKTDRNTPAVFGNYIDIYDISNAVEDGVTVPIYYESRLVRVDIDEEGKRLIEEFEKELNEKGLSETEKAKTKWAKLEAIVGSKERVEQIAKDIVNHFEERLAVMEGKGMIVAMTRRIAVKLYNEIIKLRPDWHSDELKKGKIKLVMTVSSSDEPEIAKFYLTKEQRRILADRFKDPEDELKLVIVVDMWLTGFDVPCLHTMYIDKPMKGHTLMQAIARVNRVYKDKTGGLIVDYLGIAADLKEALKFYADSGGKGDPAKLQEEAMKIMLEKLEVVRDMFFGFDYKRYFNADTKEKLSIILEAANFILGLEDGKKRFIDAVTALSKAFAIAIPHPEALKIKEEVAFFQALKSRLIKFDSTGRGKSINEIETAIKQVIDKAMVSNEVIDVFDAAGLKKPDISILSDEFLEEIKEMKHQNIAIEVLKKIINDEIKGRIRKNLVKSKSLMESLEELIRKYNNKILTATQVIEELIALAKDIRASDKEPEEMGLSEYEYAFYCAVADNESARELMGKDKLRELAVVLYDRVKKNTSIDWTIRESARARLRVIVKRTLRKYGYPPDMQALATETVLKQAELIADEIVA